MVGRGRNLSDVNSMGYSPSDLQDALDDQRLAVDEIRRKVEKKLNLPPAKDWDTSSWWSRLRAEGYGTPEAGNAAAVQSSSEPYGTPRKERQAIGEAERLRPEDLKKVIREGLTEMKKPTHLLSPDDFFPLLDSQEANEYEGIELQQRNLDQLYVDLEKQPLPTRAAQKHYATMLQSMEKLQDKLAAKRDQILKHLIKKHEAVLKDKLSI